MIGERIYSGSLWEEKVGYARAVVVDNWVFLSGTAGFDPETNAYPGQPFSGAWAGAFSAV
jgi:enamine deaminase RidA (YjgF/YER057c/UK114 family)